MGTSSVVLLCNRAMRLAEHGAVEEARALLRQAAEKAGDERRLQGLIHIAFCRLNRLLGDLEDAHAHGERALELLKGSGGPDEIGEAMICLALVECKRGKYVLAEGLCRRALKLLQASGNQRLVVLGHWASGFVAGNLEQIDEAYDHLQTAFASADGLLSLREQGTLRSDLAIACRERGELDEALRLSREALGIMELAGDVPWVADLHNTIGAIHARRGDREAAFHAYESAHAILGNDTAPQAAECHAELARLELEGGRPKPALEHAQVALKIAHRLGSDMEEARSSLVLGRALVSLQRPGEAIPYLRRARDVFSAHDLKQSAILASEVLRQAEGRRNE